MKKFLLASLLAVALSWTMHTPVAYAAITEDGAPIDGFFEQQNNVGPGSVISLAQFRLAQTSGSDTLSKVGFFLVSSTTLSQGEISRVSLWKESGTNPGFQIDQDTFIAGAASTSPMADTLITLSPTSPVAVGSTGDEYYIIASTTAAASITNGHGFHVELQTNYASTSAGGLGTAFISNRKTILYQGANLKISEIKLGSTGNTEDEFIELYNAGSADINLSDLPLSLYLFNSSGGAQKKTLTYVKKVIPGFGFFLIGSATNYSGTVALDASYDTITNGQFTLVTDGGVSIATSSTLRNATSSKMDLVCWGSQPSANCESTAAPLNSQNGTSMERLAQSGSTAGTMGQSGADAGKGNSYDTGDNSANFVVQTTLGAQNTSSSKEYPFGGGGQDTSNFQVMASYPGSGQTGVPVDMTFLGFMFNKTAASSTISSATATTTVTLTASGSETNLCTSVTYNPFPGNFEPQVKCNLSASLSPNTTYTFTATSSVRDLSGNFLDQNSFLSGRQPYQVTFTTGSAGQTMTNVTPPTVVGTSPFRGSTNIPRNLSKIAIEWNQPGMDLSTFTSSNIYLSGGITLSDFSFSTTSNKNNLTATLSSSLAANTTYTLTISSNVKSSSGIYLPATYTTTFTTSAVTDTTAPTIVGVLPTNGTTISPNTNDFIFTFDDNIDATTATSGAVTLAVTGGANLPVTVSYLPVAKEGHVVPSNVLPLGQELTLTIKGASIKNAAGVRLGTDVTKTWTVAATNNDTTPPSIVFATADDFNVAITWNEAINSLDATTLANYSLTVGGVSQSLSALAGQTMTYDPMTRTARLSGIRINSGSQFVITANNVRDVTGNTMTTASSFTATADSYTDSGGNMGPGNYSGSTFGEVRNFSSSGIGFMPPVNIRPLSVFISATSTYEFELPIAQQIPANGTIVITFPSSSDYGICCVATTSSSNPYLTTQNADINGSNTGTVGIKSIVADSTAKTLTLTLDTATRSENSDTHDFLRFSLANIKNPSIPKGIDTSGYNFDIKSKGSSGALLESFTANPIYIGGGTMGGGAVTTIRGTVSGGATGLEGVTVHLDSPTTGSLEATTDSSGAYQFANIPVNSQYLNNNFGGGGEYMLYTDPFISPTGTTTTYFGQTMPTPVQATSTSLLTRNFSLAPTTAAINFTVKLTAPASTFTSTEQIDVFAGGPGQFVVRTITPGTSALDASTITTLPVPKINGTWGVGIGPAMPKSGGSSNIMVAPSWVVPKNISVIVSGCPTACVSMVDGAVTTSNTFVVSAADKTITGVLKDGSGNSIASAMVFAFAPSTDAGGGTGNSTQSSTAGTFTVRVTSGTYVVGAYSAGIGESKKATVVVDSSGNVYVDGSPTASTGASGSNPFIIKMTKPSYTITGQVTDGTNAIGNATVYAYRTNGPGRVDAMSDSSTGNYTLYVDNGTWKVGSFVPGFGPMSEQTVTVAGASQANINFSPSSSQSFSILSGSIYEDLNSDNAFTAGEGITGAIIRVSNGTNMNEGVSGSDGAYTVRVPSSTGYRIRDVFSPSYGRIADLGDDGTAIGTINLTSSTTKNIRIPVRSTVNIKIKDSDGNPLVVSKAFIDLFDKTNGLGNHVEITNASSTSLSIASSTSAYSIRAFIHGVPPSNISVASDASGTSVSSGNLTIGNSTESIRVVVNTSTAGLSTISGTVYKNSATAGNELDNAWIQFVDQTNGVQFGTQATSSGKYSIKAVNGTYQVLVSRPQYVGTPATVTVSGTTTQDFVMTSASLTISGTVTAGGSSAANSFVRAEKVGGGQAVTQSDSSGAYTLNVTPGTWKIFAAAEGYLEGAYASNPLSVSSAQSGIDISLSNAASLQSKLATSNTFTDTAAGSLSDSTVGVEVNLDANALGSASASSYLTAKETSNFADTTSVNIVANKAKDISAFSGGNQVTDLESGKKAEIKLSYTKEELASSDIDTLTEVGKLTVVSYSADKGDWETLSTVATYKDASGNTVETPSEDLSNVSSVSFTASGTHFSNYALSSPTGVTPPETPAGLTATASSNALQIALSWSSSADAEGYYIYRDTSTGGSFPMVANTTDTSYTNTGLAVNTTYYYKVSAYKSSGDSESAASSAVSATTYSGAGARGGGGAVISSSSVTTTTTQQSATTTTATSTIATLATSNVAAVYALAVPTSSTGVDTITVVAKGYKFLRIIGIGSEGVDVKTLQDVLEAKGFLKMPSGVAKGYYGALTKNALKKFQKFYGVANEKDVGYGNFGPKTRAKLNELVASGVVPSGVSAAKVTAVATTTTAVATTSSAVNASATMTEVEKATLIESLLKQLAVLQELLKQLKQQSGQ